jgi:hypothetical protein
MVVPLLLAAPATAQEVRVALGAFTLTGGMDFQLNFRPDQSHLMFGFRYNSWEDEFEDPFTGRVLDKTQNTMLGPTLCYLFDIASDRTWYIGASILEWSKELQETGAGGQSDSTSVTAPFFGGGYMGEVGVNGFYNIGMFISGAELTLETGSTFEQQTGIDFQLQLGFVF